MSLLLSLYLSPLRRLTHPRCWTPAAAAETSCLQYRMSLLLQLARAYTLMSRYDCPGAVAAFRSLPKDQYRTPWVLCQMAKAHFVQTNYQVSCWLFEKPRRLDPDHVTDMDVYSTALWHLHKVTELSALSEELADSWYLSPQAWCAKGNCLSMHKEHEDAIKFFRRPLHRWHRGLCTLTHCWDTSTCTLRISPMRRSASEQPLEVVLCSTVLLLSQ